MSIILKCLFALFWLVLIPYCIGGLYTFAKKKKPGILAFIAGYVIQFALFEVVSLPLIFAKCKLTTLIWVYTPIILVLAALSVFLNIKYRKKLDLFQDRKRIRLSVIECVALTLILGQVLLLTVFVHIDDDDAFYVGASTMAVETNSMYRYDSENKVEYSKLPKRYVLSPMPIYTATYNQLTGIDSATLAHTALPAVLIPLCYSVYTLIGRCLFGGNRNKVALFLVFTSAIILFSGYSVFTQGAFMLFRIWQGKALLASALLPAVFLWFVTFVDKKRFPQRADWWLLFMLMAACSMVSSMGVMLGAISVGILTLVHFLINRDLKFLWCAALACIPNLFLAAIYLFLP